LKTIYKYGFIFILLAAGGESVHGQSEKVKNFKHYSTAVKTNPFVLLWGSMLFTTEFRYIKEVATAPKQSLLFGFSYMGKSPLVDTIVMNSGGPFYPVIWIKGFRMQFMYKMYFSKHNEAPIGWYTGPYYSYSTAKYSMRNYQLKGTYIQGTQWHLSWVIGQQKLLGEHFCYDLFAGLGYKENSWEKHTISKINNLDISQFTSGWYYNSHFKFCGGLNFGYIF
jgi:hypothetical protein